MNSLLGWDRCWKKAAARFMALPVPSVSLVLSGYYLRWLNGDQFTSWHFFCFCLAVFHTLTQRSLNITLVVAYTATWVTSLHTWPAGQSPQKVFYSCESHTWLNITSCSVQDGEVDAEELQRCLTQSGFSGSYTRKLPTLPSTKEDDWLLNYTTPMSSFQCLIVCFSQLL